VSSTSWGYAVIAARSLEQASRELDNAIPQLIVTDFRSATETTGIDVVHAVRKAIGFDVPAIIITGDTSPQGISEANASGFTVSHKPLDITTLKDAMSSAIRRITMFLSAKRLVAALAASAASTAPASAAGTLEHPITTVADPAQVRYGTVPVDGSNIAYREAGDASLPKSVSSHGWPSSSHQFRDMIPSSARRFHVIAPDYQG
ncbi:hypothetical protein OY671_009001, partial [Metschnikowia pulcherrima]